MVVEAQAFARSGARRGPDRKTAGGARRGRPRDAFTLIEMLIVIGLIALFSTLLVVNLDSLLRQSESEAVQGAFWLAVRDARTTALLERRPQALRFDEKEAKFLVDDLPLGRTKSFAIDRSQWAPDTRLEVALKKRLPPSQFSLVQGEVVDLRDIPSVGFFPDGTCLPFVLSLRVRDFERTIEIDPWTGTELLPADEK